jgi:hypothetical protein
VKVILVAIILFGVSGCAPSMWREAGFEGTEMKDAHTYNDKYWYHWEKEGYTPIEAKKWFDAGFTSVYWGVTDKCPTYWKEAGFTPQEAKEWRDNGFYTVRSDNKYNPKDWKEAGFTPQEAKEWVKFSGDSDSNADIKNLGVTIKEAKEWKKVLKVSGSELAKAIKENQSYGIDEIKKWTDIGISTQKMKKLKKAGIPFKQVKVIDKIIGKYQHGWDSYTQVDLIIAWAKTGFKDNIIKDYKHLGVNEVGNQNNLRKIMKYCSKIENPKLTPTIRALGVGATNGHLSSKNIYSTKDKCFNYYGKVQEIRNQKEIEIKECVKINNKFDDCMEGRVSIMKFSNGIPSSITRGSKFEGLVLSGGNIKEFLYEREVIYPVLED